MEYALMVLLVFKAQFQLTRNIFMDSSPGLRKIEARIKIPPPFFAILPR